MPTWIAVSNSGTASCREKSLLSHFYHRLKSILGKCCHEISKKQVWEEDEWKCVCLFRQKVWRRQKMHTLWKPGPCHSGPIWKKVFRTLRKLTSARTYWSLPFTAHIFSLGGTSQLITSSFLQGILMSNESFDTWWAHQPCALLLECFRLYMYKVN